MAVHWQDEARQRVKECLLSAAPANRRIRATRSASSGLGYITAGVQDRARLPLVFHGISMAPLGTRFRLSAEWINRFRWWTTTFPPCARWSTCLFRGADGTTGWKLFSNSRRSCLCYIKINCTKQRFLFPFVSQCSVYRRISYKYRSQREQPTVNES